MEYLHRFDGIVAATHANKRISTRSIFQENSTASPPTQVYSPGFLMFIGSKKYILSYCLPVKGLAMKDRTRCGRTTK